MAESRAETPEPKPIRIYRQLGESDVAFRPVLRLGHV